MKTNKSNLNYSFQIVVLLVGIALCSSSAWASRLNVMVVDFTTSVNSNYQKRLPELIVDEIVNAGDFEVLEREKLTAVTRELALQAGALIDPEKAVQIGGMSGAQLMITGNIIENWSSRKNVSAYGINSTITRSYLKARMELIDLQSGAKIFSHVASDSAELKSTGAHSVGRGSASMGPRVASKLVNALMENTRVREMVDAANNSQVEMVSIEINSVPEGADVEIDGVFMGNAGDLFEVIPGVHEVSVTLTGYEPWSKKVKVREGLVFTARLAEQVDQRIELQVEQQSN